MQSACFFEEKNLVQNLCCVFFNIISMRTAFAFHVKRTSINKSWKCEVILNWKVKKHIKFKDVSEGPRYATWFSLRFDVHLGWELCKSFIENRFHLSKKIKPKKKFRYLSNINRHGQRWYEEYAYCFADNNGSNASCLKACSYLGAKYQVTIENDKLMFLRKIPQSTLKETQMLSHAITPDCSHFSKRTKLCNSEKKVWQWNEYS